MLLKILKENYLFNYILFPIISILLVLGGIINSAGQSIQVPIEYSPIGMLIQPSALSILSSTLINLAVVLLISIALFGLNTRFLLVKDVSFLPSYLFLFIAFAFPKFHSVQPIFFSTFFITLSFRSLFLSFDHKSMASKTFDASLFIGIASLFYLYTAALIIVVPLAIIVLHKNIKWRNISTTILGFILPWLLFYSYYFISDTPFILQELTSQLFKHKSTLFTGYWPNYLYLGYILLITINSSLFLLKQYDTKNINTRRHFKILFIFFIISLMLLFFNTGSGEVLILVIPPLTFLITNYLTYMKRKIWAEIFFIILVISSIILQFVN